MIISNESCPDTITKTVILINTTGIRADGLNDIDVYPNPTTGVVIIQIPSIQRMESVQLKLYDAIGREMLMQTHNGLNEGISIDLKELPGNIFFLSITTESGNKVVKVMKY